VQGNSSIVKGVALLTAIAVLLSVSPLYAADGSTQSISWVKLTLGMLGGLAFFLYGMEKMSEASVETHPIHMELMDALNHINIYSAEIADTLLQSGALEEQGSDTDAVDPLISAAK